MKKLIAIAVIVVTVVAVFISRNQLLHRGASNGESALIKFTLAVGADKNSHAKDGSTPLTAAAAAGQAGAVNQLLAAGATVDRKNRETGATALMEAAFLGDSNIVDSLLAAGASVSERDSENHTAYWHAFNNEQFAVARKVHWTPRREVKMASTGGASSSGGYNEGGEYNSGGGEFSSGEDLDSTEPSWESSEQTDAPIVSASAINKMKPPTPRVPARKQPQWKSPDSELSAEEADAALVKEGQVVDWKKSSRPGVVETELTEKQQKIIDEAKRKKREEKKWELKDQ